MKRIVLLFLIVLTVFFSVDELFAEDFENNIGYNLEDNIENNTSKAIEEINEIKEIKEIKEDINIIIEKPKPSLKDIFGDDQTFPFVAGFGKD